MDSLTYTHRRVSVANQWFIEIRGLKPTNQAELDEMLAWLREIHEWPAERQIIVGENEEGQGSANSLALSTYNWYIKEVRVGPQRSDVAVTKWEKATLGREQIIKGSIRTALQEEKLDHSKIINLSSELASLDESTVRFSVDAGIINRLGKELVGRAETALSELVKNGYDSDATTVTLVFKNNNQIGGTLTVTDNGNGMTGVVQ